MRPADWSAAEFASDPVPGEPHTVRRGGEDYLRVADAIDRASSQLRSLALEGELSQAVEALADTAATVADDIAKAEKRYRETGHALIAYSGRLEQAQTDSIDALHRARSAQSDAEQFSTSRRRYVALAAESTDPAAVLRYENLADAADGDSRLASGGVSSARDAIVAAASARDTAAQSAIDRIENTTGADGLGDSWWQDWGADVLAIITDVAGWVSTIAGVLALIVAFIPVIGQVLAAALLLVAGIAALVNAIGNIVLASAGERSWTEAVISIAGAALSVVGLGAAARLVGAAVKAGARSTIPAVASHIGSAATSATRINAMAAAEVAARGGTESFERLTVMQATRLKPGALSESEKLWSTPLTDPANGDVLYRLYGTPDGIPVGESARAWGASYSPSAPWQFTNVPESLGLPAVNAADNLLIAEVTDAAANRVTRHALPLNGMPGGAPEFIFPGAFGPSKGLDILDNMPFVLP